jgi:Papain-like cysteine protease AvrRpt2
MNEQSLATFNEDPDFAKIQCKGSDMAREKRCRVRKLDIAALAVLGAALFAGCGLQPGDVAEADSEPSAQAFAQSEGTGAELTPLQVANDRAAASDDGGLSAGPGIDGRAAAGASNIVPTSGITGPLAQWYTGLVTAGAQQHWFWNNAGSWTYTLGFSPLEATTATACQFQVIRAWDVQQPGGEREFHFIIQNTASISCGTNILLQAQTAAATWSTGTVGVGGTQGWTWNNANPLTAAHFVNVSPTGATATTTCEFEVTRSWYSQEPSGERRFHFNLKNVGTIACGGTVLLATNVDANSSWSTGTISPGGALAWFWNNANPLNRVYIAGVSPLGATSTTACQLELLPRFYVEMLNSDHTTQRRYYIGVKNVGTISCSGTMLLNFLDPWNTNPLPVNMYPQQMDQWCWAASAEMIMSYLGGMMSQCEQANRELARADCCNSPTPAACNKSGWPEFDKYGFSSTTTASGSALSWATLKSQIDTRHAPVAFSWKWDGTGAHMMVATGYKVINGQNWVSINNPLDPHVGTQTDILYSDYVDGAGYSHLQDIYNIAWK